MSLVPSALHARRRHGESYALAADVGGAISCFRATNSTVSEMAATATTRSERPVSFRHAACRVPAGLSRSWTGRSAMSFATDSALSLAQRAISLAETSGDTVSQRYIDALRDLWVADATLHVALTGTSPGFAGLARTATPAGGGQAEAGGH